MQRRLVQLWHRLSARERTLAGGAFVALLLVVLRYGVIEPYRSYTTRLEEDIEQQSHIVAKMQRQRDRSAQVTQQLEVLRQRFEFTSQKLIPGATPAVAAAHLQELLQTLANKSGLEVVTRVPLRDEAVGEFRKTTVQMTVRGDLRAVASFVAGVEYGDRHLAVTSLEVRGTYNLRVRQAAARNPLTITLEVGGVMQGAKS